MIKELIKKDVQAFIRMHENTDIYTLSLQYPEAFGLPFSEIATQITGRKKARVKLPEWYDLPGIVYPPGISMEQCSSQITAKHKASIISGARLIDLTGGMGIDAYYLSKVFESITYVEKNETLCEIAQHNFSVLGASNINVVNLTAEEFVKSHDISNATIFIDPNRRSADNKVFKWKDCEPDLIELQSILLDSAESIVVKASPMLDISSSLNDLKHVEQVQVISVKNECKEVLYLMSKKSPKKPAPIVTENYSRDNESDQFIFTLSGEKESHTPYSKPLTYLYEPNSSILKAGGFKSVGNAFNLFKLHQHSHLYTSKGLKTQFPGRIFSILAVVSYTKKAILNAIGQKKANVMVRNFPHDVDTIRKKTGLKPGGDYFIIGTTDVDNKKIIIVAKKL